MKEINDFLHYTIFRVGKENIEISSILFLILFIVVLNLILRLIKKFIYAARKFDTSKKYTIYTLIKYFVYVIGFVLALDIIGINVSVLMAGSAALLVGVGLGLQNLFSDFVSGIILLVDSTLKVDDVIEVDGLVCKVEMINLRTTTVLTRDDKYLILPNTILTKNKINNWTHSGVVSRFDIKVGVAYASDVKKVMNILQQITMEHKAIQKSPTPFVRFNDYADSALIFNVYFWTNEVFRVENIKSDLRVKYYESFKENNIEIPFPQRVVHLNKK